MANYKRNLINFMYTYIVCTKILLNTFGKERRYSSLVRRLSNGPDSNVKDALMYFVAWVALPRLAWPHRCIAHSSRTAVHGCSRVIMQVLPVVRPRPQTDVECWLSLVLTPSALASRFLHLSCRHAAPANHRIYYITLNVIFGVYDNTMGLLFRLVVSCFLDH